MNREENKLHQAELWRSRRREFYADKFCFDCGASENLELDHIDQATKISHKIWWWPIEKREAEIAKCVVRCHRCHKLRHTCERNHTVTHGTLNGYNFYRCRCDLCRKARRDYARLKYGWVRSYRV